MNPKSSESDLSETEPKSLKKGILANVLSYHPYLFWFSVGGPIMSRAKSLLGLTLCILALLLFRDGLKFFRSDMLLIDHQQIAFLVPNNNKRVVLKRVWYKYGMTAKGPSRQFEKNEETDVINR